MPTALDQDRSVSSLTSMTEYSLPTLSSASTSKVKVLKEYKSGASYQGQVKDNRRTGLGVFVWPNGSKYEGEFIDNDRHGKGKQEWPDKSSYEGEFLANMRHGMGHHKWANGETYTGKFFRDRRHGHGTYTWPDGSKYIGTFYMDKKEGYGKFYFANGNTFEGLYGSDERYGPGVLTYKDGRADVGLWHREKLVKLCVSLPDTFSMLNHPDFDFFPDEQLKYIDAAMVRNRTDVVQHIVHPPDQFNYPPENPHDLIERAEQHIFSDTLHQGSLAVDIQTFDEEFFQGAPKKGGSEGKIPEEEGGADLVKAWNNTPSSIAMQSHMLRHDSRRGTISFNIQSILDGERSEFPPKGPIEEDSESFLRAAQEGKLGKVNELLNADRAYVDVCDMKGHTALLGASVNWHQSIINSLLDNGADVNRLNNEGISALAACHVHFYPTDYFKYNIAERYLEKPADFETEKGFDVNEVVKGLIPTSPKRRPTLSTTERQKPQIDTKKIQKLRQEYHRLNLDDDKHAGSDQEDKENFEDVFLDDGTADMEPGERTIGTLNIKRASKINLEDMLVTHPRMNDDIMAKMSSKKSVGDDFDAYSETEMSDFESIKSVRNLPIEVSDQLIERCATHMSQNDMVVGRSRTRGADRNNLGTVRRLAIDKSQHELMETTIRLLLKRGADPNASRVPMPVLFFAIKAADVDAVRLLLLKGASTFSTLSDKRGGLSALHIAVAIPGEEGVIITELLLNSLANPDARATLDDAFLNRSLEEEWSKDHINPFLKSLSGGRTPLHIACARDDNYRNACRVVHLLLGHHANPNLLCNGHSPLALAIASGNDLAIEELLAFGADPCLPLTHGVGSALCIASNTEYEHRRTPTARLQLIDKLIRSGADILSPIPIGPKRVSGTAVDYAYYMYNLDRRIAHMPYHALTPAERETFNARRRLLAHMGDILRMKAVERERFRLEEEERQGVRSISPSPNFTYTGAGAALPPGIIKAGRGQKTSAGEGRVSFGGARTAPSAMDSEAEIRKPLFRYCYECGRSVGVRLSACTRCKEVYYCSKACKLKAWNARHKEECIRVGGRSRSSSPNRGGANRIDSPTPATDPDLGNPTTVAGISGEAHGNRVKGGGGGDRNKKQAKRRTGATEEDCDDNAYADSSSNRRKHGGQSGNDHPRGGVEEDSQARNNRHRRSHRTGHNDDEGAESRPAPGRKAWAAEDEECSENYHSENRRRNKGSKHRGGAGASRSSRHRPEHNKLNLGLSEEDEDEEEDGFRRRRRHRASYTSDEEDDGSGWDRKNKNSRMRPISEDADWMSPRRRTASSATRNSRQQRPHTDNEYQPTGKWKRSKGDPCGADNKSTRRWAKAPAETQMTSGGVSMLHPKVPGKGGGRNAPVVKVYQLPPIAESPSAMVRHATLPPKGDHSTHHHLTTTKGHGGQPRGVSPLGGRSQTFPGMNAAGNRSLPPQQSQSQQQHQVRGLARVKMHMKINLRPKQSRGASSLPETFAPHLPGVAGAVGHAGVKVSVRNRSHSAAVSGTKGARGRPKQNSLFPELNKNKNQKAQTFHGLTSTKYALTIMPHLNGGPIDLQHYKYIYLDNYSFN